MIVFAIDPGNVQSAYCMMNDKYELIEFAKAENDTVLEKVYQARDTGASKVVIERVASYGMAVGREVFETCEWIGRFTEASTSPVEYIYRKDEKVYLCNDLRAKDSNIRQALIDRFAKFDFKNGRGTKKEPDFFYGVSNDIWAAIAVGVTWLDMKQNEERKKQ